MIIIQPNIDKKIVPPNFNFDLDVKDVAFISDPTSEPLSIKGLNLLEYTSSSSTINKEINVITTSSSPIRFWSSDESKATVNESGYVESLQEGSSYIYIQQKSLRKRIVHQSIFENETSYLYDFVSFDSGTLGSHILQQISSRLDVDTEGIVDYTTLTSNGPIYRFDCWAADLDWTGCAYKNINTDGSVTNRHRNTLTMITPRHALAAEHSGGGAKLNETLQFLDSENTIHERTVTHIFDNFSGGADLKLCQLNEDLPSTIKYYKLMPYNWIEYLPLVNNTGLCYIFRTQYRKIRLRYQSRNVSGGLIDIGIKDGSVWGSRNYPIELSEFGISPTAQVFHTDYGIRSAPGSSWGDPVYAGWVIPGDSGHPFFNVINNELILVGVSASYFQADDISRHINTINNQLSSWGSNYTATIVDLSMFSYYGGN